MLLFLKVLPALFAYNINSWRQELCFVACLGISEKNGALISLGPPGTTWI